MSGVENDVLNGAAARQLKTVIERVERLNEDKEAVSADIKEVYSEAKGNGFDTKIIRKVVKWRAQDREKRQEEEAIMDLYLAAIGENEPQARTPRPAPVEDDDIA